MSYRNIQKRKEYYRRYYQENKDYYAEYYQTHKKKIIKYSIEWAKKHKKRRKKYRRLWVLKNRKKVNEINRRCGQKLRKKVLFHYGNKCQCCGETQVEFLAIDHINNDGHIQRKNRQGSKNFYRWVVKNNFPKDLQVLCHNCNIAKALYGYCPHKNKKELNNGY